MKLHVLLYWHDTHTKWQKQILKLHSIRRMNWAVRAREKDVLPKCNQQSKENRVHEQPKPTLSIDIPWTNVYSNTKERKNCRAVQLRLECKQKSSTSNGIRSQLFVINHRFISCTQNQEKKHTQTTESTVSREKKTWRHAHWYTKQSPFSQQHQHQQNKQCNFNKINDYTFLHSGEMSTRTKANLISISTFFFQRRNAFWMLNIGCSS